MLGEWRDRQTAKEAVPWSKICSKKFCPFNIMYRYRLGRDISSFLGIIIATQTPIHLHTLTTVNAHTFYTYENLLEIETKLTVFKVNKVTTGVLLLIGFNF